MTTERMPWHATQSDLAEYLDGGGPPVFAASIEAHLLHCAECRAALRSVSGSAEATLAWDRLADAIDRPSRTLLGRLTGSDVLSRSTLATPAMAWAAVAAIACVCLVPLIASGLTEGRGRGMFLVLAPLAPVVAVAVAYGSRVDPSGELSLAAASTGLRLVSMRALVVASVAVPLSALSTWLLAVPAYLALAWCLPGLALAALVLLAGTTRLDPRYAAAAVSVAWAFITGAPATLRPDLAADAIADLVSSPATQATALAVAGTALALSVLRRDTVAYRRTT